MRKEYIGKKELSLPEGFQEVQGTDGLIFLRLLGAHCGSARLA
jgi:hypothetical protein